MNAVTVLSPGKLALTGAVDVDTAFELEQAGMALIDGQVSAEWVVDMSEIERADSAALALMLSWIRDAAVKQVALTFTGLPDDLRALAGVCCMGELLPLS